MNPWDEINFWCATCGARPGQSCVTAGGLRCSPHSPRMTQGDRVWFEHHPDRRRPNQDKPNGE